jgi:hypothetical protein
MFLVLAGVILRLALLVWSRGTMIDDAYITLRCAENLLAGHGLLYNAGERVLCVTGPLYGAIVAGLLLLTGGHGPGYVLGVASIAAFAGSCVLLARLLSPIGRTIAILVVTVFAFLPAFVDNTTSGMETQIFVFGMLLTLWLMSRERIGWVSFVAGLLMLVRPEGVLWALALLAAMYVRGRRVSLRDLAPGLAVLVAWAVLSFAYYGSPIPHTLGCKSGLVVPFSSRAMVVRAWNTFLYLSLLDAGRALRANQLVAWLQAGVGFVMLAFFVAGTRRLIRDRSVALAFPLLYVGYLATYVVARARADFSWYGIPSGLAWVITVSVGLAQLGPLLARLRSWRWMRGVCLGVLAVALLGASLLWWGTDRLRYYRVMRTSYEASAEFVREISEPDATLLVDEVGMIGYTAQRYVWDLDGIVSREFLELRKSKGWWCSVGEIAESLSPDYVVLAKAPARQLQEYYADGSAGAGYVVVREFPRHIVLQRADLAAARQSSTRPAGTR